ncbi:Gfo/Idh/MocA family protein [Paenactinomyces guangxiensis]|uniref:Gfo/Idh/MocA family oxidoreductase n=1 Tax=Paenactinomyces guangxiensis TaxID=1490290 RepID=A0A7W2A8Q2_9BACL|nr:Gfo/Idh/MocA family oxidoreductase [Paenactinomyces guangxiensis]MBA4494434.1 Gfo/Idh/MocA family oxidoreductase [Paenactinomyces guangxiensis]MBH8591511.1 Gfo/Idh/MocA family oxidoreductase [Paenactinomyces guangxiensis]
MTQRLRVGIIGAGGIASDAHIPNYLKCGDKVELIAIADVVKEKALQVAQKFHIPHAFSNYEKMLQEMELDAVSICTPNKFHAPAAVAALEAGCHVLCEKPPAMTASEAERMARIAKQTGKILTYGFHYRHSPQVEALKRFIDANELGEIYSARAQALRRRGIPGWGVFTNKELQGGGALIDVGVHMLDTALYLMGYPEPAIVLGSTYQKIGTRKGVGLFGEWDWKNFSVEDLAQGMIRFKNGATLLLEAAFAANIEQHEMMQVSLMGDQGGADVFPLKIYQEKYETLIDITPSYLPKQGYHEVEIARFVDSCLTGTPPLSTPKQGTILQHIIEAFYQSAETGEAVKISLNEY